MSIGGRDFLRMMNDQSRRAADFDRRLRWSVLRQDLSEFRSGRPSAAEEAVDLRPSEERAEPPQQG